jgi:hypothetical protein
MWPPARGFGMPGEYDLAEGEMRPSTPVQRLTQRAANDNGNNNRKHNSQNTEITEATEKTRISKKRCLLIRVVTV